MPSRWFRAWSRHTQDRPRREAKWSWFQMSSIFPNWEHSKGLKVPSRVQRSATSCITGGSVGWQQPAHVTPKPQKVRSWATGANGGDELWDPHLQLPALFWYQVLQYISAKESYLRLLSPKFTFFRWRKWSPERSNDSPKVKALDPQTLTWSDNITCSMLCHLYWPWQAVQTVPFSSWTHRPLSSCG